jgi:phosphoglycolate phosphatase-like HAD superfamily hydrolase
LILNASKYQTLILDCDGVLLDSNRVKTEAFRQAALPYGESAAERLVQHHVENGGVSRYKKFEYFLEKIVPEVTGQDGAAYNLPDYEALLSAYAVAVHEGLRTCAIAEGLEQLRAQMPNTRWLVVSGGDQAELRGVFDERGIADYFDDGIFGSPHRKGDIVAREIANGNIKRPALFLGDSRLDHEVAAANGLDFVFVSQWTEMPAWQQYLDECHLTAISGISELSAAQASTVRQPHDP